ncbi:MAG: glutathione S-transferase [Microcoleus sp. PH2017_07_MST_O_A]|uniref:glutathione S-transferase family protein n=1 Tax=Microcoleus sp. PH2017_28_MFU_U_A TaxID=2798838 RepID=UPI001E14A89F|nr:glutathione S-transferase family protein [Microcoleus sp. PH2017_28_MFU_U_A]MCC3417015.1 glutathione S-transferase [Microcoleus sp. PH2017_07_MST_O_A]MCC3509402.1 glutathione S-transferase [Microcoleus sp. PH2017_17_BER_D_A]TAG05165.1 MAG: glutathione S-transferase [Oscillatoriales cyanobacterium]MCC3590749.1 glutathione S-transferase [Microcoleus sp. PH2017_28_MFU_U_A]TAG59349.1 MAG: glutathione S-transferase [Oscillatoriales cyanobacterium]
MNHSTIANTEVIRLITIPISHYCEKVRWALDLLKIPYIEERHVPPFHRSATSKNGGSSVPVLVTKSGNFTDSTDILHYLDTISSSGQYLYPTNVEMRQEVEELEELFDAKLGADTRNWGYFYRSGDRKTMRRAWCNSTPVLERIGFEIAFPLISAKVRQVYNITADSAASSLQGIKEIFEIVDRRLAGGKTYLVGDTISAADITFAALAAPVLLPSEHPVSVAKIEELPIEMAAVIKELQSTAAGVYALRLYRDQRRVQSSHPDRRKSSLQKVAET